MVKVYSDENGLLMLWIAFIIACELCSSQRSLGVGKTPTRGRDRGVIFFFK